MKRNTNPRKRKHSQKMVFPNYKTPSPTKFEREYFAPEEEYEIEVQETSVVPVRSQEPAPQQEVILVEETFENDADQSIYEWQDSDEVIIIRDSQNVTVQTTDTQVAVSLQISLQLILSLLITISIADTARADRLAQDLCQHLQVKQQNTQRILIENSRDITVTTTDTDVSVSIQAILQAILAIVARIEVA